MRIGIKLIKILSAQKIKLMSILIKTSDPTGLLAVFKKGINNGTIVTWSYDQDGDFTHTPDQWKNKAWLRPSTASGELSFSIIGPKSTNLSSLVYAVYHGRFIEALLNHCDQLFTDAYATAMPTSKDRISN